MTNTPPRPLDPIGTVVSVNVGAVREIEWRGERVRTGIWKTPVGEGPVHVAGINVAGDDQGDRRVHGGADKAVYAYAVEDYAYWREAEDVSDTPGLFGENLTVRGIDLRSAVVGERWRIGSVLFEVAQPRLPCYKLGIRLNDATFPKRFLASGRLGAYLRIIEPGELRAGDSITRRERPSHGVTLARMHAALHDTTLARAVLPTPGLPESWRRMLAQRVGDAAS